MADDQISARWVQRAERETNIFMDQTRRRILATLLTIPPAAFGLPELTSIATFRPSICIMNAEPVDQTEYETTLTTLWASRDGIALDQVERRIYNLEQSSLYGTNKPHMSWLLCEYLCVLGNMYRDRGFLSTAITTLNKAVLLAEEKKYPALLAKALYLRGYAYFDQWGIQDRDNRSMLGYATSDFAEASTYETSLPVKAAILAEYGLAQAYNVQDAKDRTGALKSIDRAGSITPTLSRDQRFMHINNEWYFIDKSEACVALGWSKLAIEELDNIPRGDHSRRRYTYIDVIEAEAYVQRGWVEVAVERAESVLDSMSEMRSETFIARMAKLYTDLRATDRYRGSVDVARLGVKVLKAQHPDRFMRALQ